MNSGTRKILKSPAACGAALVLLLFLAAAAVCEIHGISCAMQKSEPLWERVVAPPFSPPSADVWAGSDYQGRSVLLRAAAGAAPALKVGLTAGLISVFLGTVLGVAAGFFRGRTDDMVVWGYSTFASMPTLLFVLSFALLVSRDFMDPAVREVLEKVSGVLRITPGALAVYIAIGITSWVGLCRVVRAETMKLRRRGFVEAARIAGVPAPLLLWKHILPNIRHLTIIYFTLNFGAAVMLEVLVGYLGLNSTSSMPGWGSMIAAGQERLWRGVWWELTAAGVLMFILILALNILGDTLRDIRDPGR